MKIDKINNDLAVIYKITSPSNRVYVGQAQNINKRLNHYKNLDCKSQRLLYSSLVKYGYESHNIEILEYCNVEDLNNKEIQWISELKTNIYTYPELRGMNLCDGGNTVRGHKKSAETLNKMRKANLGKKHSIESSKKKSESNKGKVVSIETRIKLSKINKGKVLTEEHKQKLRGPRGKQTISWTSTRHIIDVCTGIYYYGFRDAAESINMKMATLVNQLTNKCRNKTNLILL